MLILLLALLVLILFGAGFAVSSVVDRCRRAGGRVGREFRSEPGLQPWVPSSVTGRPRRPSRLVSDLSDPGPAIEGRRNGPRMPTGVIC